MSNDRRPDQNEPDAHDVNKTADEGRGVDLSRRRFSRAGLIAAPVIMTLASRPVLGGGRRDCLSNMMSAHSGPDTCDDTCKPQHSCKDWKTKPTKWGQAGCNAGKIEWVEEDALFMKRKISWGGSYGTKCRDIFPFYTGNETMMDVLWKAEYDKTGYGFIASAVTAYCNAKSDSTSYGLTSTEVKDKCDKALGNRYENIYTKTYGDDCITALRKEFEYLNGDSTDAPNCNTQDPAVFDCDTNTYWDSSAYDDCKEYYAFRKSDKWKSYIDKECKSWSEYKSNCKGKGSYREWRDSSSNDSYKSYKGWNNIARPWRRNG